VDYTENVIPAGYSKNKFVAGNVYAWVIQATYCFTLQEIVQIRTIRRVSIKQSVRKWKKWRLQRLFDNR
jgi:hypothetical protein